MAFARLRLDLSDWPAADRAAWLAAIRPADDPLSEPGLAAHWTRKTAETVRRSYGIWLAWLQEIGRLNGSRPDQRISREALAGFVAWLQGCGISPVTQAGRIRNLREAIRVMCAGADLGALDHLLARLEAGAHPVRHKA